MPFIINGKRVNVSEYQADPLTFTKFSTLNIYMYTVKRSRQIRSVHLTATVEIHVDLYMAT